MPVLIYIGFQGSGKTLSMIEQIKKDYDNGMKIYSNVKLYGIEYEPLDLEWFHGYLLDNKDLNNVSVMIDELQLYADSRNHKDKKNKVIGYFALQTRKRNVKLYGTTQYFENIDKRLRQCALDDVVVMCKPVYAIKDSKKILVAIKQQILYKGRLINRIIKNPSKYYGYYKTGEVMQII